MRDTNTRIQKDLKSLIYQRLGYLIYERNGQEGGKVFFKASLGVLI